MRTASTLLLLTAGLGGTTDAADRHVPGQTIVRFVPALRGELGARGGRIPGLALPCAFRYERVVRRPDENAVARGLDLQCLLTFDPAVDVPALVSRLLADPLVEYACPNVLLDLDSIPDDSLYPEQWHLEHIGAPHAWAIAHGDSNVRLAVVADGVHYGHPDLAASFRVSPLEDINGNRRFDPQPPPEGDLDGLDNDGNGYIDDVIGYDFLDGDPNPVPADREAVGTHGAGTQNAVTDNHVGVSAPPWNVRSIVVRCGSLGSISLFAAISAIYYLVGEDVWSFGMPFGSYTPYQPLADACLYAWESGAIPCGSAGGDGGETIRYPAGHEGVISVASHGRDNWKSPWSNYGAWIDVTAPGDTILSTAGPAGYAAWDGTSVACNVVVGILGWIKSAWPDISNDSALSLLRRMCDTMPDPLYWQGKLGAGRVRMSTTVTGLAGTRRPGDTPPVAPTIVRSVLFLPPSLLTHHPSLFDISGRAVMSLRPGPNDVSGLSPGVYVVRSAPGAAARVVLAR